MLDKEGYRPNVGIILANQRDEVFWGKRVHQHAWQFPQGGIQQGETPLQAMFRELEEEIGLQRDHVRILGRTREWLRYDVPEKWTRRAACEAADEAGAQHQAVADDLGLGRDLLLGGYEEAGSAHSARIQARIGNNREAAAH